MPEPAPENSFHLLAIWDGLGQKATTAADVSREMDKLIQQFGPGNKYHRGIIIGGQTHSDSGFSASLSQDLRCYQWRRDGVTWASYTVKAANGQMVLSNDPRDLYVPTPSRYCPLVFGHYQGLASAYAAGLAPTMAKYPGTIAVVNAVIEEELATGCVHDEKWMADYSPFAITEFRDWLRHTGMYDADTGKYAGQGALESMVGPYVTIAGKLRSPFYDDPAPGNANGTGVSFNQKFGAAFTTWTLKSWDLKAFPNPITDRNFKPTPTGTGHTEAGFDAPGVRNNSAYWDAWSWDYEDHANTYPPGNPANPAFGFRQVMLRNHVMDFLDVLDPKLVTQYSSSWGIFEWHPSPFSKTQDTALYPAAKKDLDLYYTNNARYLFPGWWFMPGEGDPNKIHGGSLPVGG